MIFRDIKNKIRFKYQKVKKGYCDYDLYDMDYWFIKTFPKMLGEFAKNTIGYPMSDGELQKEVEKMDKKWLNTHQILLIDIRKKHTNDFDLRDDMSCWVLILLRMKHCFEMCDEWNDIYEPYRKEGQYEAMNDRIESYKKEAFYLFEKYFFHLWW